MLPSDVILPLHSESTQHVSTLHSTSVTHFIPPSSTIVLRYRSWVTVLL